MTTHRSLHPSFGPGRPALRFEPVITLGDGDVRAHEAIAGSGPRVGFGMTEGGAFEYLLDRVAERVARWTDGAAVSINVTLAQLLDPELPRRIAGAAERTGVAPARFLLEIDAAAAERNPEDVRAAVERLQIGRAHV